MKRLINRAQGFPLKPGVYFWKDKNGKILYIGRATFLRKRVAQYFRKDLDPRIAEMVTLARKLDYRATDTVLESIFLEANLIKKYHPKYNILSRDDKSFAYIVIPRRDFTYPIIVRQKELQKFPLKKTDLFGPYQSAYLIRKALQILRRVFPYSTRCTPGSGKPCFDYQIGLCPGACVGEISARVYARNIASLKLVLRGENKRLIKRLKKDNPQQLTAFQHIQEVALLTKEQDLLGAGAQRIEAYDISHLAGKETYGAMAVFCGGEAAPPQYRLFRIREGAAGDDLAALREVLRRRFNHPEWPRPDIILIDGGRPQVSEAKKELTKLGLDFALAGLSKFAGDELVFPAGTKESVRTLITSIKSTLQQARDEAHRFSRKASRRRRRLYSKSSNKLLD